MNVSSGTVCNWNKNDVQSYISLHASILLSFTLQAFGEKLTIKKGR